MSKLAEKPVYELIFSSLLEPLDSDGYSGIIWTSADDVISGIAGFTY